MNSKTFRIAVFIMSVIAGSVMAGAIHTWAAGDQLNSADLNANFQHIHNNMVGGHGARLVDADVSASAAIASSKLAAYRYVPVAWANMGVGACTSGTCSIDSSAGVTSIAKTGTGVYRVTMSTTRTNVHYAPVVGSAFEVPCSLSAHGAMTATTFDVYCYDYAGSSLDAAFSFVVFDND
jgi:hypothetical protein